jgi:hypothetical protein
MDNKVNKEVQQDAENGVAQDEQSVLDLQKLDEVAGGLEEDCGQGSGLSQALSFCGGC